MKKYILIICMISFLVATSQAQSHLADTALFVITVQFPSTVTRIPSIRGYCAGEILPCDFDYTTNRASFIAQRPRYQTLFDVVITPSLAYDVASIDAKNIVNGTLHCLKVPEQQTYKCYTLELITILPEHKGQDLADLFNQAPEYTWRIVEQQLPDRKIPDQALIICTDPAFVSHLAGGSAVELPKIIIKPDILSMVESEKSLHEQSTKYILDLMPIDLLHVNSSIHLKTRQLKNTIVAMNIP